MRPPKGSEKEWTGIRCQRVYLRVHAEGTGDPEEHCVVLLFGETVVLQEHARVRVDVGPRVLRLAVLRKHAGRDFVDQMHELDHLVVLDVLEGKLPLALVSAASIVV